MKKVALITQLLHAVKLWFLVIRPGKRSFNLKFKKGSEN